jgi:hypothetical protein
MLYLASYVRPGPDLPTRHATPRRGEFGYERAGSVEEFFRLVGAHPRLELGQVPGVGAGRVDRIEARAYTREHSEDAPEINDWKWRIDHVEDKVRL